MIGLPRCGHHRSAPAPTDVNRNVINKLIEKFRSAQAAVLLGTATFWQGIDVPGDALQVVVITKLPFAVPDQPLVAGY